MTANCFQIQHDLHWLLMYGSERQVGPVVMVNPGWLNRLETWMDYFQTRNLGQVIHPQMARLLAGDPEIKLLRCYPPSNLVFRALKAG